MQPIKLLSLTYYSKTGPLGRVEQPSSTGAALFGSIYMQDDRFLSHTQREMSDARTDPDSTQICDKDCAAGVF